MAGPEHVGRRHTLLPQNVVFKDDAAYNAFESYLNKAVSESTYTDFIFWKSTPVTRSANDARQAIARHFSQFIDREGALYGTQCPLVVGAYQVYRIGSWLDTQNHDGGGISFSDVMHRQSDWQL